MGLNYQNLDADTRAAMVEEIKADAAAGKLYMSPRFAEQNPEAWAALLTEAAAQHDDNWLASEVRSRGMLKTEEQRKSPKGGFTMVKVPSTAPDTLSEGEFNRFYSRGLCARAIKNGVPQVEAYRARQSENPRPESQSIVGRTFAPAALLNDLRASIGVEPALGLPPGPNSGLSVRLPQ